jgi:hypothetical protein
LLSLLHEISPQYATAAVRQSEIWSESMDTHQIFALILFVRRFPRQSAPSIRMASGFLDFHFSRAS